MVSVTSVASLEIQPSLERDGSPRSGFWRLRFGAFTWDVLASPPRGGKKI